MHILQFLPAIPSLLEACRRRQICLTFQVSTQNAHKDTIKKANKQIFFLFFVFFHSLNEKMLPKQIFSKSLVGFRQCRGVTRLRSEKRCQLSIFHTFRSFSERVINYLIYRSGKVVVIKFVERRYSKVKIPQRAHVPQVRCLPTRLTTAQRPHSSLLIYIRSVCFILKWLFRNGDATVSVFRFDKRQSLTCKPLPRPMGCHLPLHTRFPQ